MTEKLNYIKTIKYLSTYIKKHKRNFKMFYLGWLFETALSVIMPILLGNMIDEVVYYQNLGSFLKISLIFVVMSIFSCALYFFIYAQHHYLMNMYTYSIKKDIFDHMLKCDAQFMTDAKTGDIITTIQKYTNDCMHFVIRNIIHFINGIIVIVITSYYLIIHSWEIGLFVLIAAPLSVFVNYKFGKKIRGYNDKQRKFYENYISWIFEILSSLRDIRMLGAQQKTYDMFEDKHKKMFDISIKTGISAITANNIINFVNLLVQLSIFGFAGYLASSGKITIGLLTIVLAFYGSLTGKFKELGSSYLDAQGRISSIQRIKDFLNSPTEDSWQGKNNLEITNGNILFKNLKFAYNKGNTVLQNINLDICGGDRFGIVGKSGCGKTTLAYMLIGFYNPQMGEIIIDGQKLSDCTLKSIRKNIGLIAQDVLIFDGTIKENIMLGNNSASDSEIENSCDEAGLRDFIEKLPNGINTVIGTKGIGISGGQKQRISIARIYLKKPKIIIFDEATSSLDKDTEESIHSAWKKVLANRTSIIISHRQSSVMLCNKLAIIDNGEIIESGESEQVMEYDFFKKLFAVKDNGKNV